MIREDNLDPDKVLTIHNGVDLIDAPVEEMDSIRSQFELQNWPHVVVSVGHIRRIKGFDDLIRCAALVTERAPDTLFLIAGAPAEKDYVLELNEMLDRMNLRRNVRFIGPSQNIPALLKVSTVFCLLSRSEGFSNAVLEAMAQGLPVVVTDVGGNSEAVEQGRTGYLVRAGDYQTAAQRILSLIADPALAESFAARSRQRIAQRFTFKETIRQLSESYVAAMENSNSR
jgi:glycosyltransferase involved in cell wall biosynthesis